jgi:LmbE family N-acetylglucosaminyl deacetylase
MFPHLAQKEGLDAHVVEHLYLGDRSASADVCIDISETIDRKVQALLAHKTQIKDPSSVDGNIKAGARTLGEAWGYAYGESFKYFFLGK